MEVILMFHRLILCSRTFTTFAHNILIESKVAVHGYNANLNTRRDSLVNGAIRRLTIKYATGAGALSLTQLMLMRHQRGKLEVFICNR